MGVRWGREIGKILWEMRWLFLGFALLWAGIHYAFVFWGYLFFNGRGLTAAGTLLLMVFVGMILYGLSGDTKRRVEKLEKDVEELQRKLS